MPKIIYAIIVNSGAIGTCLDAIRLLASPMARRFSHLTVIGPLDEPLSASMIAEHNSRLIKNSIILSGTGNFFGPDQNTVFFNCKADMLREFWRKRDYPGEFNPHVTIYDGDNPVFASELFSVVSNYEYNVTCGDDKLTEFEIGNGKNGYLSHQLRTEFLPPELQLPSDLGLSAATLRQEERLVLIDRICRFLSQLR